MKKLNRRKFLQRTGLAVGAVASVSPASTWANILIKPKKEVLGVALVGLGYYSRDLLAPALQQTKHCQLKGIVTGSPDKIPAWQREYDIEDKNVYNYENIDTIADNPDIDVVYIVLPTGLHAKYAIKAAEAGKHVWCEKPMARTVKECQQIIDACERNKVKLSIGYRMQHEPNTQIIMRWADDKPFGQIEALSAEAGYYGGRINNWKLTESMGGGAIYDMGVYPINGLRYATGLEPIAVKEARHVTTRPKMFTEVDETTYFTLEFAGGIEAEGATSFGHNWNKLRVNCTNGWYELSRFQSYSGIRGTTSDGQVLNKNVANQQAKQMDNDALAIINDTEVIVPGEEGLKDIRIVEAIKKSARTGQRVLI